MKPQLTQTELLRLDELENLPSLSEAEEHELQKLLDIFYADELAGHMKGGKEIQ